MFTAAAVVRLVLVIAATSQLQIFELEQDPALMAVTPQAEAMEAGEQ